MPPDDRLVLPPASSLPHPLTNYFCRIGRVIDNLGFIGYRSRIWRVNQHAHEYTPFVCWFNRGSEQWESLPDGYTTSKPPASHSLEQTAEWWEEAQEIIQLESDLREIERREAKELPRNMEDERAEPSNTDCNSEMDDKRPGHGSESSLTPSDYSESKKAALSRREQARKNRGLGHDEMNTEEEEADDEKMMVEEDKQERRRSLKAKKRSKKRHLVKGKQPAEMPSVGSDGRDNSGEEFSRTLRRLVKSKPPPRKPAADSEGVSEEDGSPVATAGPITTVRALGKQRADPPESMKRGPYTAHEIELAMELADTIVSFCKNMGRTPESVLRKGGFNVSLSREPSRWDIWQMYLARQTYNPSTSMGASFRPST